MGYLRQRATYPSPSPEGTRCSPGPADIRSSSSTSSTLCSDWGTWEMLVVMILRQIPPPRRGISFPGTGTGLCTLGRRRLHPPSAQGLRLHPLGGFTGGKQWRRAWICRLRCGSNSTSGWMARSITAAATVGNGKP
jgi:hypothetical protein